MADIVNSYQMIAFSPVLIKLWKKRSSKIGHFCLLTLSEPPLWKFLGAPLVIWQNYVVTQVLC